MPCKARQLSCIRVLIIKPSASDVPCQDMCNHVLLIYFLNAITGLHFHEFLKLCIHISGGIIADHMSGYG